jgi:hypothetical protein
MPVMRSAGRPTTKPQAVVISVASATEPTHGTPRSRKKACA